MKRFLSLVSAAILTITAAGAVHAQAGTTPAPAFEVASVKPSNPNSAGPIGAIPIIQPLLNGRFTATNVPLRLLVRVAYGVEDFQIQGGPSWQMTRRFDIAAKAPDAATGTPNALVGMLKTLLADRFKLRTHTETKDMPVYDLVVLRSDRKLGPGIMPSTSDCGDPQTGQQKLAETLAKEGPAALAARLRAGETIPCSITPMMPSPGNFGMRGNGQPVSTLIRLLTTATGRTVRDKTGLTGRYDWTLTFDPQVFLAVAAQAGVNVPPQAAALLPPSDSPALLTAIQEQLGLKLESTRGPVETLVIDSAEMPEEN